VRGGYVRQVIHDYWYGLCSISPRPDRRSPGARSGPRAQATPVSYKNDMSGGSGSGALAQSNKNPGAVYLPRTAVAAVADYPLVAVLKNRPADLKSRPSHTPVRDADGRRVPPTGHTSAGQRRVRSVRAWKSGQRPARVRFRTGVSSTEDRPHDGASITAPCTRRGRWVRPGRSCRCGCRSRATRSAGRRPAARPG
jgi:hypothetical protein